MLTIGSLAKEADVPIFTVRHYTRIGLLSPRRRASNGYRIFEESDVSLLKFITNAKHLGFTLKEIGEIVDMADHGESPCPLVREIIVRRIDDTEKKIAQMRKLLRKMREANDRWKGMKDTVPDGHAVCHLIESFGE